MLIKFLQHLIGVLVFALLLGIFIFLFVSTGFSISLAVIQIIATLVVTFLGVFLSFWLQAKIEKKREHRDFQRLVLSLQMECANQIACAKVLLKNVVPQNFNLSKLSSVVGLSLVNNSMTYYYFGKDFLYNLQIYISQTQVVNSRLDFLYLLIQRNVTINADEYDRLYEQIEKFIKLALLLQIQLDNFVHIYQIHFGPDLSGQSILATLKNLNKHTIKEFEDELKNSSKISPKEISKLRGSYIKALKKL